MPVVSSKIWRKHDRGNGRLSVGETHIDHEGRAHERRYSCDVGFDTEKFLIDVSVDAVNKMIIDQALENESDSEL